MYIYQCDHYFKFFLVDINECTGNHNCEEFCLNTEGSFQCTCSGEYIVASDGRTCVPSCGGRFTEITGRFSSPGWPIYYHSLDFRCVWEIDIENYTDAVIDIVFQQSYGIHGLHPCRTDYVEILEGVGEGALSLGKYCSTNLPQPIATNSNQATVIFQASTLRHSARRVGVGITYTTVRLNCKLNIIINTLQQL